MARSKVFNEENILNKALDLFWSKGYNGTSAQDLVDGLKISRSSLYDTFGDKHSLFLKSLTQYCDNTSAATIDMIDKCNDPEQTIRNFFEQVIAESTQNEQCKGCFMVNAAVELAPHDCDVACIVDSNRKAVEDALCRAITKGQETGQFTTDHTARSLARFLFNAINGLRVASKYMADKVAFDEIVNVTLSVLKRKDSGS